MVFVGNILHTVPHMLNDHDDQWFLAGEPATAALTPGPDVPGRATGSAGGHPSCLEDTPHRPG
jgi:hypothetical protein